MTAIVLLISTTVQKSVNRGGRSGGGGFSRVSSAPSAAKKCTGDLAPTASRENPWSKARRPQREDRARPPCATRGRARSSRCGRRAFDQGFSLDAVGARSPVHFFAAEDACLLYTSPSPRD